MNLTLTAGLRNYKEARNALETILNQADNSRKTHLLQLHIESTQTSLKQLGKVVSEYQNNGQGSLPPFRSSERKVALQISLQLQQYLLQLDNVLQLTCDVVAEKTYTSTKNTPHNRVNARVLEESLFRTNRELHDTLFPYGNKIDEDNVVKRVKELRHANAHGEIDSFTVLERWPIAGRHLFNPLAPATLLVLPNEYLYGRGTASDVVQIYNWQAEPVSKINLPRWRIELNRLLMPGGSESGLFPWEEKNYRRWVTLQQGAEYKPVLFELQELGDAYLKRITETIKLAGKYTTAR